MSQVTVEQATIQRVTTIDTKGGGFAILLTTTGAIHDDVLVKLMRGRGSVMKLTLEDVQMVLMDDPNAGVQPTTERVWETTSGDVVKAHVYQSTSGDERCDLCGHATNHEVHRAGAADELADKLLEELAKDPDTKFPEEQAEGRTALASRSRSSRNGAE